MFALALSCTSACSYITSVNQALVHNNISLKPHLEIHTVYSVISSIIIILLLLSGNVYPSSEGVVDRW